MELSLRPAGPEDIDLLYRWANDPVTRQNGFHTEQISYEEHRAWYAGVMQDDSTLLYICLEDHKPVGQIRLRVEGGQALISYSVDPENRGRGVGTRLLGLAEERLKREYPRAELLWGEVKYENVPSLRAFEKNGYAREDRENCVVYRKEI